MSTEIEKAVHKAVNSKAKQPKRKHVRSLIIEVWNENSARGYFAEVAKRPIDTNEITAFKAFTVTHKVLQEGPKQALIDGYYKLQWIDGLRDYWLRQGNDKGYGGLISEYGLFLHDKVTFHHRHSEFEGDISSEKFQKIHKFEDFDFEKCVELISNLLDLQESVFKLQNSIMEPRNVNDVKAGALIPLVLESYSIYSIITLFLTKLVARVDTMETLKFLIERFYTQYITLRDFYINANAIRSVSTVIAVPNLPVDPPQFNLTKKADPKPRIRKGNTPVVARREVPPPSSELLSQAVHGSFQQQQQQQQQPQPFQQQLPPQPQPFFTQPPPQPAPVQNWNPFMATATPTNVSKVVINSHGPPMVGSSPQPQEQQQWVTFGEESATTTTTDPFSNLMQIAKSVPVSPPPSSSSASSSSSGQEYTQIEGSASATATTTTPPATTSSGGSTGSGSGEGAGKTRVITKVITKTINNTAELNKLKARIEELEAENATLKAQLTTIQGDHAHSQATLSATRSELEKLIDQREKEWFQRAVAELGAGKDAVEMQIAALASPTNLGNPDATASLVVEDVTSFGQCARRLVSVALSHGHEDPSIHQEDLFAAVGAVTKALSTLFHDAKGASRSVDDGHVQSRLLDAARSVGSCSLSLLESLRIQGGQPQDEEENKVLETNMTSIQGSISQFVNSAKELEQAVIQQQQRAQQQQAEAEAQQQAAVLESQAGIDLDDLAERELRAAAKTIEDAAKALMAAKAAKPVRAPSDKPDVAEAILEAAMAIAAATASLVTSAAVAQRERVETGRSRAAQGVPYKRDPTWAEGLISAAKAVANATAALVGVANDAAQGKGSEEALIAVSKAVGAATSQLVAAARAKSDVHSPVHEKLSSAAKAVSHATALLVAAAKAVAAKEDEAPPEDFTGMSATGFKVKEMEQQMLVLRLEKELHKARNSLLTMRKSEYASKD